MTADDSNAYVIGVDVGGTKVAAGFVSGAGEIGAVTRVPMVGDAQAADGLNTVTGAIDHLVEMAEKTVGEFAPSVFAPRDR
jgi:predicted NBD/HSP70 family sugar kinase